MFMARLYSKHTARWLRRSANTFVLRRRLCKELELKQHALALLAASESIVIGLPTAMSMRITT